MFRVKFLSGLIVLFLFSSGYLSAQESGRSSIIETYHGESWYMHFVEEGETVQSIAKLYGVSNLEILNDNPEIATGLKPGRVIRISVKNSKSTPAVQQPDTLKKVGNFSDIHVVAPKETWYGIARLYKVPVKDLISENPGIDTLKIGMSVRIPQIKESEKVITEGFAEHTVLPQETLYGLSGKYNTSIEELIRLNPSLKDGLKVGQVLMVPVSKGEPNNGLKVQVTDTTYKIHIVQRKETLYSISKLYNVSLNDIVSANPHMDGNLKKGDELRIPQTTMKVRPYVSPDTIIMGRPINKQAVEVQPTYTCKKLSNNSKQYNVALMLPLKLEMVDSIRVSDPTSLAAANEIESFDFIQFYQGALIAADSMAAIGMNVKLHIYDTDFGSGVTKTKRILNQPSMKNMDLIIGPFFAESFDITAQFAKMNSIPIINPLSRRTELIRDNDYIIKMQPSNWSQYNALSKYILQSHANDNIILVRRNQDENSNMSNIIKNSLTLGGFTTNFHEVIYSSSGWSGISRNLSTSKKNIVLLLTNDQAVLPALLRDLSEKAESHHISVVGLPLWEDIELDYNYLVKLNTHFVKPWFVDYDRPEVVHFIKKFRSRYVAEPELDKYSFLGYDSMLYFLSALYDFGDGFIECIEEYSKKGLSNDMIFVKSQEGGFENQSVSIYKFNDFKREKLN